MRILIIDDNQPLAAKMKKGLEGEGFCVDLATQWNEGEEKAFVNEYDAVLLDLNLPDADGFDAIRSLREAEIGVPIMVVTARNDVEQLALALDLGADDYLVKPFEFIELRARVQAVVRRFQGRANPVVKIGALLVDPKCRQTYYAERNVVLKPKEFDILNYIASNHPAVISTEAIIEHVYDENFDPFSSVVRVHMARLKKSLADAAGYEILKTIRGKGYVLCESPEE